MADGQPIEEAETFFRVWNTPAPDPIGAPSAAQTHIRKLTEASSSLWRAATSTTSAPAAPLSLQSSSPNAATAALIKPLTVEIGRTALTDAEKWKLQATLRREEVSQKKYNTKLMRPTKTTKGPSPGDGFPAGRGRPVN